MGLDVTHDCWNGPYSAFRRFRDAVADAARRVDAYEPDYEAHPFRAFMGWWFEGGDAGYDDVRTTLSHPLDPFFVHSDCDGFLFPRELHELIPALTRLLQHVEGELWPGHTNAQALARFIAGLQQALDDYEIVRFH